MFWNLHCLLPDLLGSQQSSSKVAKPTFYNLTDKTSVATKHKMHKLHFTCTPYDQDNNKTLFYLCITCAHLCRKNENCYSHSLWEIELCIFMNRSQHHNNVQLTDSFVQAKQRKEIVITWETQKHICFKHKQRLKVSVQCKFLLHGHKQMNCNSFFISWSHGIQQTLKSAQDSVAFHTDLDDNPK